MPPLEGNRRDFIFGMAGVAATAWLVANQFELRAIAAYAATVAPDEPYEFFSPGQARDFDAISAQIVPTDDTAGAREAHVVRFADRYFAVAGSSQVGFSQAAVSQAAFQDAYKRLGDEVEKKTPGSRSFAALSDADQIILLTAMEKTTPSMFNRWHRLTMLGMFCDPMHGGNDGKLGWRLIGFEDRYSWTPPFGYYDRA